MKRIKNIKSWEWVMQIFWIFLICLTIGDVINANNNPLAGGLMVITGLPLISVLIFNITYNWKYRKHNVVLELLIRICNAVLGWFFIVFALNDNYEDDEYR